MSNVKRHQVLLSTFRNRQIFSQKKQRCFKMKLSHEFESLVEILNITLEYSFKLTRCKCPFIQSLLVIYQVRFFSDGVK